MCSVAPITQRSLLVTQLRGSRRQKVRDACQCSERTLVATVLCSTDSIGVLLLTSFCQVSAPERRLGDTHPRRRTFLASPGERPESHLTGEL